MALYQLAIPAEYGYVLLAASSTFFLTTYHGVLTTQWRKASGIKYPNCYASAEQAAKDPNAFKLNCAQRAHANFTENHTSTLGALLLAGLKFPLTAAVCGGLWTFFRIVYAIGYTSDAGPPGRARGSYPAGLADLVLKVLAVYTSVTMILESSK